ncbi:gliding motility-associated peptidyl-prolyl isomerase GldI [Arenibacter sp. GZD96]|uniref:gliding motility-associated peptidyl-prolyl isomerase GldI n=1 Tax=Aurantibrevibacter litoralis TaxID=3106030 RepID=UPI002AFEF65C|nr:gliding motility-associated peptidyl-prolyl isomerase GldI [Arenibacter sp. GZD-96]MEA1785088.1 gliding motility-associated peptidyl-prolyl isomerase GldI [Arenibacter sp. GZD-96]
MRLLVLGLFVVSIFGCTGPEPRRPIKAKTASFIKESAERNKALLAEEERLIQELITKDTLHEYKASNSGSWYYYEMENTQTNYYPKTDDLVTLTYSLRTLQNEIIYTEAEIDTIPYVVDKESLFPGLRYSIKLLKENEKATFLFPSSLAFGYHGDNDKIGPNLPLKATITILDITKYNDTIQH